MLEVLNDNREFVLSVLPILAVLLVTISLVLEGYIKSKERSRMDAECNIKSGGFSVVHGNIYTGHGICGSGAKRFNKA